MQNVRTQLICFLDGSNGIVLDIYVYIYICLGVAPPRMPLSDSCFGCRACPAVGAAPARRQMADSAKRAMGPPAPPTSLPRVVPRFGFDVGGVLAVKGMGADGDEDARGAPLNIIL